MCCRSTSAAPVDYSELSLEELLKVKISTASRNAEDITDAPASVYVISQDDIRKRGYSVLGDVLRDLPGMEVIENYFSEQGTLVPVRGVIGNNKIVLLVNGMRVNPPGGEELMIRSDVSVRSASQIEIIYGPGATLYGQDALSGIINIITEKPEELYQGQATVSYGTEEYKEGFFQFGTDLSKSESIDNPVKFSGFLHLRDSDLDDLSSEYSDWWDRGFGDSAITAGTPPEREDRGLNGFARLEGESSSVQVWYRESRRSSSEGGYTGILYFVDEAVWEDSSLVIEARNTLEFTDSASVESKLTYNRYEIDPATRYVFSISDTELFLDDFKYGLGKSFAVEEVLRYSPMEDLDLTAGAQFSFYDVTPKATIPGGADTDGSIVQQGGEFTYYTEAGRETSMMSIPRATNLDYENYGFFVEGSYNPFPDWKFIAGVRVDVDSRFNDDPVNPRLAAIYNHQDFGAKLIYTEAYVAPAPYFSYNVFDNGFAMNIANPDLEPEEARSTELNLTWTPGNFQFGTSLYYNEQDNLILVGDLALPANIVADEVYLDVDGTSSRVLTRSTNGGESTAKGIDVYGRYAQGRLSGWASYSFVDFETDIDRMTSGLQQISKHNARLGLTYEVLSGLFFTPSVVYRSDLENVADAFGLDSQIKDPFEINAHLLYAPCDDLDIFVSVRNITDEKNALKGVISPTPQDGVRGNLGVRLMF